MIKKINKRCIFRCLILSIFMGLFLPVFASWGFEEVLTVPAEDPKGVTVTLEKGTYKAELIGGGMTLFYPINPNYSWIISVAVGADVGGGQDTPNIGTIYLEPAPPADTQAKLDGVISSAIEENNAPCLKFTINEEEKEVRFWVSDFDYTDNSGMAKIRISSVEKEE